jgi:hypothetical protein
MPRTNVKPYTLPVTGSFIGQAGAEYAITVGFNALAQGTTGSIQGKIIRLSLDTVSGENTGN